MRQVDSDVEEMKEVLKGWDMAEKNLRVVTGEVARDLLAMKSALVEVEYWTSKLEDAVDDLVTSSHRRSMAEGVAMRGHDGQNSWLPAGDWWRHKGMQTVDLKEEEQTWYWQGDELRPETSEETHKGAEAGTRGPTL